jgi:hypothetical protein
MAYRLLANGPNVQSPNLTVEPYWPTLRSGSYLGVSLVAQTSRYPYVSSVHPFAFAPLLPELLAGVGVFWLGWRYISLGERSFVPTLIFPLKVKCHAPADLTISFGASFLPGKNPSRLASTNT